MKRLVFCFILLLSFKSFSQTLEEQIYQVTETFIANKNALNLIELEKAEANLKLKVKTKDEQLALVFLLCNKGHYLDSKIPPKAISNYEEAWSIFSKNDLSKISDYDIIEYCLKPLGNLYTRAGDFTNAELTINNYISLAKQRNDQSQQISGIINLSILYQVLNKHNSVVKLIDQTLVIPNIKSEQILKLESIKQESLIKSGQLSSNRKLLENDIQLPNSKHLYVQHELNYKSNLKEGNYKEALKHFNLKKSYSRSAIETARDLAKQHVEEAQLYFLLSDINRSRSLLEKAVKVLLPHLDPAQITTDDLYAENTFIDVFDQLAIIQSSPEKALQYYDMSFHVSQLLSKNITSQESKLLNITNNRNRSEACISVCYDVFSATKDSLYIVKALEYAEQHKSTVLKEQQQQLSLIERFPNDSLLLKQQELQQFQEQLINEFVNKPTTENVGITNKLSELHLQIKQTRELVSKKYSGEQEYSFSLDSLQQKLNKQDATLIQYFYGNSFIYKFTVTSSNINIEQIELTDVAQTSITSFIKMFENSAIINNNIPKFKESALSIFQLLKPTSTTQNLVIIPDSFLSFLPFETLLESETNALNYSKMPFLGIHKTVIYNSSIYNYTSSGITTQSNSLLGIFPVFEGSNQELKHSVEEATSIEDIINSKLFLHSDANKQSFITHASNYDVLHLSTHASGGSFAIPASISFYNETMTFNELYRLNLKPNLVVLSACETGIGILRKGEGAMSIARGFQYAGSKNLLFSLWSINDMSTASIMKSFYNNYSKTNSGAIANQSSKLVYLNDDTISNAKKSPYYWSAFVYYGDFSKIEKSTFSLINIAVIVLVLIIVLFLLFKIINSNAKIFKD